MRDSQSQIVTLRQTKGRFGAVLKVLASGYFFALWLLLLSRFVIQDRLWILGFLNSLTPYWFLPLLIVAPVAHWQKHRVLQILSLISIITFLILFGELFIPKWKFRQPDGSILTIMTYNLLGWNYDWTSIQKTILDANADVIALQELNREMAEIIRQELISVYPYQILDAQDSLISRYPITLTDVTLPDSWGSPPQIYQLDFDGQRVMVLNAHLYASIINFDMHFMQWVFREREHQAQLIVDFAANADSPLIVTADLNATDQNQAYRIVTQELEDTWREAGWGFGHTFPGGHHPDLPRPIVFGYSLPMWMARIDYILYSDEWCAVGAKLGRWDGVSDHRPVIATLELCQ